MMLRYDRHHYGSESRLKDRDEKDQIRINLVCRAFGYPFQMDWRDISTLRTSTLKLLTQDKMAKDSQRNNKQDKPK